MRIIVNYQAGPDSEVTTPAELDEVLDHMRQLSIEYGGYGVLGTSIAPDSDTGLLDIGAHGDSGFLHFHWYRGGINVDSLGEQIDGWVDYWFQEGNHAPVPASAEIPYDDVRKGAHEFLASNGQQPTGVTWQPHVDYVD